MSARSVFAGHSGATLRRILYALFACLCEPAFAITQFLTQDLGVNGNEHLCKYTDGKVYAVQAYELCPLQIEDSPSQRGAGRPPMTGYFEDDHGECLGYSGPGGSCYSGPGGGLYGGPGGGLYSGPDGGLYAGPGGGLYAGPGGGMYAGPGGGLYAGPGGGLYGGPGGGMYGGPPSPDANAYHGPWGPCITGAATRAWLVENCPNRR